MKSSSFVFGLIKTEEQLMVCQTNVHFPTVPCLTQQSIADAEGRACTDQT